MSTPTPRRSMTITEACAAAQVSRRTIYNWLQDGKLEYRRTAGGQIRIFEDSLWRPAHVTANIPTTTGETA